MAVTRKQDDGNNKKEQGKKEAGTKRNTGKDFVLNKDKKGGKNIPGQKPEKKETVKKDIALVKDKKDVATKKDPKKDQPAKKEKVNYIETVQKFVKGAYSELKKVNWPGRRELIIYTAVVVVAVLFVGALIWLFDSALSTVLRYVIDR